MIFVLDYQQCKCVQCFTIYLTVFVSNLGISRVMIDDIYGPAWCSPAVALRSLHRLGLETGITFSRLQKYHSLPQLYSAYRFFLYIASLMQWIVSVACHFSSKSIPHVLRECFSDNSASPTQGKSTLHFIWFMLNSMHFSVIIITNKSQHDWTVRLDAISLQHKCIIHVRTGYRWSVENLFLVQNFYAVVRGMAIVHRNDVAMSKWSIINCNYSASLRRIQVNYCYKYQIMYEFPAVTVVHMYLLPNNYVISVHRIVPLSSDFSNFCYIKSSVNQR